jgi:hypothetical protein
MNVPGKFARAPSQLPIAAVVNGTALGLATVGDAALFDPCESLELFLVNLTGFGGLFRRLPLLWRFDIRG